MAKKKTKKKAGRRSRAKKKPQDKMSWRDFLSMADNNEEFFGDAASGKPELTEVLKNIVKLPCFAVQFAADLAMVNGIDPQDITIRELFVLLNLKHALLGDGSFNKNIWERIDGRLAQSTEVRITGKMSISEALNIANAKK